MPAAGGQPQVPARGTEHLRAPGEGDQAGASPGSRASGCGPSAGKGGEGKGCAAAAAALPGRLGGQRGGRPPREGLTWPPGRCCPFSANTPSTARPPLLRGGAAAGQGSRRPPRLFSPVRCIAPTSVPFGEKTKKRNQSKDGGGGEPTKPTQTSTNIWLRLGQPLPPRRKAGGRSAALPESPHRAARPRSPPAPRRTLRRAPPRRPPARPPAPI